MIKKLLLNIGMLILSNVGFSIGISDSIPCDKPFIDSVSKVQYFIIVDSMPEYPGGQREMMNFFIANFKYPAKVDACCSVYVSFIIDTSGNMIDLKIVRGLQEDFDNETLRVMRLMPKWKPGKCNGHLVNVKLTFPIRIALL